MRSCQKTVVKCVHDGGQEEHDSCVNSVCPPPKQIDERSTLDRIFNFSASPLFRIVAFVMLTFFKV